jgi:anaerobic selenocysteine-containing dehydrogenase
MAMRRTFLKYLGLAGLAGVASVGSRAWAAALALVADTDPQAAALGYRTKAADVDKAKFTKYAAGQQCSNCALFQGKAGDATGACPLYAGKLVAAGAWCSAYNKKPG